MLKATERAQAGATRHLLSPLKQLRIYRKSSVPDGGWTDESATLQAVRDLNRDILNAQRLAIGKGSAALSGKLRDLMVGQVNRVIARHEDNLARIYGIRKSVKSQQVRIAVDAHERLWQEAIESELSTAGIEASILLEPAWQSVAANTFDKVSILLGTIVTDAHGAALHRRVTQETASRITKISETTRARVANTIHNAIQEGRTVFEVADDIRARMPQIAENRVPTIVRTEMGRASDTGTKVAMRESNVVSHMSVVGCEAIESRGPKFGGIPTCNIQNIPIANEWDVEFHINHTGAFIVTGFIREDGTHPNIPLRQGGPVSY